MEEHGDGRVHCEKLVYHTKGRLQKIESRGHATTVVIEKGEVRNFFFCAVTANPRDFERIMQKQGILFLFASTLIVSYQVAVVESQSCTQLLNQCISGFNQLQARADCTDVLAGRFRCNYPGIPSQADLKYFIQEYETCMNNNGGTSPYYRYDDGNCATRPNDPVVMFRTQRI
ncbi:unnamed protein product [Mortierella alpina]